MNDDTDYIKCKKQWFLDIIFIFKDQNNKKEDLMKKLEEYVNCDMIDNEKNFIQLLSIIYSKTIYDILEYDEGEILFEKEFLDTFFSKINTMLYKINNK